MPYAKERLVTRIDDCWFYHVMDLPGFGTVGEGWDLRGRIKDYIGHVDVAGKRVLDIGTASGFLTFEMEKLGAEVISLDADSPKCSFFLPFKDQQFTTDREGWERDYKKYLERMTNGYWFAHRLYRSKAKVVYANVYDVPAEIGKFDVAVIGQVLVHLSDPVRAISSVMNRCADRIVITEGMVNTEEPIMSLCGRAAAGIAWSWWHISVGLYRELFTMAGFEIERIERGMYRCVAPSHPEQTELTTIVARRIEQKPISVVS